MLQDVGNGIGNCLPTEHLNSAQELVQHMSVHSGLNLNLAVLAFEESGKTSRSKERVNKKLNPHITPGPGIEPGPHWWEESALTTAPSLLPKKPCVIGFRVQGPVSRRSRNFTGHFRVSQFPLYLKNGEDLSDQTSQ